MGTTEEGQPRGAHECRAAVCPEAAIRGCLTPQLSGMSHAFKFIHIKLGKSPAFVDGALSAVRELEVGHGEGRDRGLLSCSAVRTDMMT